MTTYTHCGPRQSYLKSVLAKQINNLVKHKDLNLGINPVPVLIPAVVFGRSRLSTGSRADDQSNRRRDGLASVKPPSWSSSRNCSDNPDVQYHQSTLQSFGSHGSALTVAPFNQASKQDIEAFVDYIDANFGREIDGLDDKSELAHPMILVNLPRILEAVKNKKARHHFVTTNSSHASVVPQPRSFRKRWFVLRVQDIPWNSFPITVSESWGECLRWASADIG